MRFISRAKFVLSALCLVVPLFAQPADCTPGRDLLTMPEIKSSGGRLKGVIMLADEQRSLAGAATGTPCAKQHLRYFKGFSTQEPVKPWPSTGDILPGPTLRARVGDLVMLTFLNQINTSNFPSSLDQGEQGKTDGCDSAFATRKQGGTGQIYPRTDKDPNCLHGSSTANIHFHGTHTTPSTTGDNVLLFVRPALRQNGQLLPEESFVNEQFAKIFEQCEAAGSPDKWGDLPADWRDRQKELLELYDTTAPYKGVAGALPAKMKLWPKNQARLDAHQWPQYSIGAFPYCFRLPDYDAGKVQMGQSPGTHWYHAHKHGSTALNVANGMTGAFIIEGAYDDALRKFYKETPAHKGWGLQEQVLVLQQLDTALNLLSGGRTGPSPISVNGRLNPVVTMRPGQVQLWRVVNGAPRSFVQLDSFEMHGLGGRSPAWRQIAQDGVQYSFANYQRFGTINAKINLAPANRADLLVRAPAGEGDYALKIVTSVSDVPAGTATTLLTVRVKSNSLKPIDPPMNFIVDEADFPKQPAFLADIAGRVGIRRELVFNTDPGSSRQTRGFMPDHKIDGKLFDGMHVDQTMVLGTTEEWTVLNQTADIAHPFHIHINPFQITEVFQPNSASAKDPTSSCFADPMKPDTWKPCVKLTPPFVWWDVFGIPTARAHTLATSVCTQLPNCPAEIQPFTKCDSGTCTVTIPGYFRMRSRFVDFTGQYVMHCHILAHEDRGMMQLVQVLPQVLIGQDHH
jgi:FtsP/CotA-like multicopper oxidase with cupredoxin domain